jgi:putative transposase
MQVSVYHVMTKSIAGFKIFNNPEDFARILNLVKFFQKGFVGISFNRFDSFLKGKTNFRKKYFSDDQENMVEIIAYCIMPTHLHFILQETEEKNISKFMGNVLNGYTRYFNIKNKRKGPLWEGRFKKVEIETDEQLVHLTRYLHLNPVTAHLIDRPEDWQWSSYKEYLGKIDADKRICCFDQLLKINAIEYEGFVNDQISYQRELAKIKNLLKE